jgi:hypothetical protein
MSGDGGESETSGECTALKIALEMRMAAITAMARRGAIWSNSRTDIPLTGKYPRWGKKARMYSGHQKKTQYISHTTAPTTVNISGGKQITRGTTASVNNPAIVADLVPNMRCPTTLRRNTTAMTAMAIPIPVQDARETIAQDQNVPRMAGTCIGVRPISPVLLK